SGLKECHCVISVRCHHIPETPWEKGIHCYFQLVDGDGNFHVINGHAATGITGPVVVTDQVTNYVPTDPGSWPIKVVPDEGCKKTKCLIDLAPLFTGLKLQYNWF